MNPQDYCILVVDDEELNRDLLARRLVRSGYRVVEAKDGNEALKLIQAQSFDMVLLDVMMPEIDGLEVLTTIRETYSVVDLPVIMATARDQGGDVVAALQLGANDYVTKPLNFALLLARIQTQFAIRNARLAVDATTPKQAASHSAAKPDTNRDKADPATPTARGDQSEKLTILGDYQILEELGRGGMGVVYKARHQHMNRLVALKVIDRDYLSHESSVRRFYQEIQAAAQLSHPNIVLAYDAGQCGEVHYFAMEYCEGLDLAKFVKASGPLPVDQACDLVRQAALGLQHAHERGFVHRDIKPSNIFITGLQAPSAQPASAPRAAVVKILDLGLALLRAEAEGDGTPHKPLTLEGVVIGSVDYMAPEQWLNAHQVDIRADLYSLGCVFYFLLTGRAPFAGDDAIEKMLKHNLDEPTPLEEIRPEVSPKLIRVVQRLMAKKPEQRYQTPGELAELLRWLVPQTLKTP